MVAERLSVIDFAVIAGYVLIMIVIGVLSGKKVKNSNDFANAGQGLSWMMIAGSTIATTMGANMVIGKYDLIFESGMSGITAALFWWFGWLVLLCMIKALRSSGAVSIPDFLEKRYGAATRKIASYCVLISMIGNCSAQFLAIGTILNALGLCSREAGTWGGALIVVSFTIVGGLWGVAITDTIQSVILLGVFGFVFPYAVFNVAGGLPAVLEAASPERLSLFTGIAPISMLGWALYYVFSTGSNAAFAQRIFTARTTKDAFIGQGLSWLFTLLVAGFLSALPALAIGRIFPDLTSGSQFTPLFIATYFPSFLRGLLLASLLGLMLTSGDTYLLLLASTFTDNFVKPCRKDLSEKSALLITRLTCVVSAAMMCFMALYVNKIYQLFKTGNGAYGAGIFIPLLFGCFWKGAKTKAINVAMVTGCVFSFSFDMLFKIPFKLKIDGLTLGGLLCLIICVAGSLAGKQKSPKD